MYRVCKKDFEGQITEKRRAERYSLSMTALGSDSDIAVGVRGCIEERRTVTWHRENTAHHVPELPHCW